MAKIYRVIQIELNQLISFRKCPHERRLTNKAYLSAVIVTNIYQSLSYKIARIWNKNYVNCHPMYWQLAHSYYYWLAAFVE